MGKANYTPGPWSIESAQSKANGLPTIGVKSERGILAEVYLEDEGRENAHLISAAPEMYELLTLIAKSCNITIASMEAVRDGLSVDLVKSQLKAVLSKAKGK